MTLALTEIQELLKQTMGMDPVSVGSGAIQGAVRQRMSNLDVKTIEDYCDLVRTSQEELAELIETVVVPETWFFRDPEAFAMLARMATEKWLAAHSGEPFRLLSIPCATGEEPYSMVMALLDAGFPRHRIYVYAADISAHVIARAKRGIYGSNSFRAVDLSFRDRYFHKTRDGYTLLDWLPAMVNFTSGNILSPGFCEQEAPFDVIFCRNLLIYLDRPTQEQVIGSLGKLLRPDGLLFVGPAETYLASGCGFTSVNEAMSFAFRKSSNKKNVSPQPGKPQPPKPQLRKPATAVKKTSAFVPTAAKEHADLVLPPFEGGWPKAGGVVAIQPKSELETIRHLADTGRSQEAVSLCQQYLKEKGPSSETYYLLGLLRDSAGERREAEDCYRKALYLEPDHLEALVHLALLTEASGDLAMADRFRERAHRVEKNRAAKR